MGKNLRCFVDDRLSRVGTSDILLFPLLTRDLKQKPSVSLNHWTLISLDLSDGKWRFYNSMGPRRKGEKDIHLDMSQILVSSFSFYVNCICFS